MDRRSGQEMSFWKLSTPGISHIVYADRIFPYSLDLKWSAVVELGVTHGSASIIWLYTSIADKNYANGLLFNQI